jgi:hypothetical protein
MFSKKGRPSRPERFKTPITVNAKNWRRDQRRFFIVFGVVKAALISANKGYLPILFANSLGYGDSCYIIRFM